VKKTKIKGNEKLNLALVSTLLQRRGNPYPLNLTIPYKTHINTLNPPATSPKLEVPTLLSKHAKSLRFSNLNSTFLLIQKVPRFFFGFFCCDGNGISWEHVP
jgi:hypothetical protein